jgi:hypothetical protein
MTALVVDLAAVRAARLAGARKPPFDAAFVFRPRPISPEEKAHLAYLANFCLAHSERLSDWERGFLRSISDGPRPLSEKQRLALGRILDKIERLRGQGS